MAPAVGGDEQEDAPDYGPPADMDDDGEVDAGGPLEDVDLELGEAGRNWERPPLPPLDPTKDIGERREGACARALMREKASRGGMRLSLSLSLSHAHPPPLSLPHSQSSSRWRSTTSSARPTPGCTR